ncbi:hypothetical protein C4568_03780 [Candidatus Parcubacteria bacterium]|nr:MAG: hypothetical protein C4568_03780 [Candidatus Parcubacteria bacterium]
MTDKNGVEIRAGHLVKREGLVLYADGLKRKVSKKTWLVSKVEDGKVFYQDENGNDTLLPCPKNEGAFLIVGDESGVFPEHQIQTVNITLGGVGQKYRVHGDVPEKDWKDGDIVLIHGTVSKDTIDSGKLELVPDSVEHKHVLVVVDAISLNNRVHNG